jgi:hypothetical protein
MASIIATLRAGRKAGRLPGMTSFSTRMQRLRQDLREQLVRTVPDRVWSAEVVTDDIARAIEDELW